MKLYAAGRFSPAGIQLEDGITVSIEEIDEFINRILSESLEKYGFKYQKSKKTFSRKTKTGVDEIQTRGIARNHFQFDFIFKKRIDEIQKVITAFQYANGFNSIPNFKEHHTISVCNINITESYLVAVTYSQFKKELEHLLVLIETQILPYFDRLESMKFLNDTLNYPEKDANNPFSYFSLRKMGYAVITGLIVAKELNDPNLKQLYARYVSETSINEVLQEKLEKVKAQIIQPK